MNQAYSGFSGFPTLRMGGRVQNLSDFYAPLTRGNDSPKQMKADGVKCKMIFDFYS